MTIALRLADVRARVARAAERAGRAPDAVRLVAVSKTFGAAEIEAAIAAGQNAFGENRVQEAEKKLPPLRARFGARLELHFVGTLQRNKARRAVELFDVVQSLDRPELAHALDRAAGERGKVLPVYLQVNLDAEPEKGGAAPEDVEALLEVVRSLPHLDPLGLMAIPAEHADPERMRPAFRRLRELRDAVRAATGAPPLHELSMGMTRDFEVAIEEGATLVRIGTAIFGPRTRF